MLTKKQVLEIKDHLSKAQNPLFFFDNDADGLCSFLLLQRFIQRGKGIPIKSFPELAGDYFRKIEELDADYIFILDKPVVSNEFWERVEEINMPVVWIDHHEIDRKTIPKFVNYYNPLFNRKKTHEPVTDLCYSVTTKKEDLWLAIIGCISDKFIPEFYSEFEKMYPDLAIHSDDAFDILYDSQIGEITKIINFALKDRITNVISMIKFLMNARAPYDVLEETNKNHLMHHRFKQINSKYQKLLKKAISLEENSERFLFFQYGGDLSISSDLANELAHLFPDKIIVVVYVTGIKANISMRGDDVRGLVLKSIKNLQDATGGGHRDAVGARIRLEDLEQFRDNLGFNLR